MQPIPANRKTDGFDMAKLQKSLKQQQRRSQSSKAPVPKLSPAEIRSLNHSASASSDTSNPRCSANSNSRRPSASTPPITPDNNFHRPLPRSTTAPLPTPPRSPARERRRDSHRDTCRDHNHSDRGRPHSNGRAVNGYSRASSTSSYRSATSLHTYRGHEVTQTGHKIMLQRPQQEIVTNPLSMFSRPRQSQLHAATSPDKFKRDFLELDPSQAEAMLGSNLDAPSISSRAPSPPRLTDSPVSADEADDILPNVQGTLSRIGVSSSQDETARPVATIKERSVSEETIKQLSAANATPLTQQEPTTAADSSDGNRVAAALQQSNNEADIEEPAMQPVASEPENATTVKQPRSNRKRFSFHHAFDKKEADKPVATDRRHRRNTLSFTKTPEHSPQLLQGTSPPMPTEDSAIPKDDEGDEGIGAIPSHPAVRPPSIRSRASSVEAKPKPKPSSLPALNTSGPTYGRCACCGKIKRPQGYGTELSPVMENEHLRTNFSFEAERKSNEARRYTPIIPIEIKDTDDAGSIRTVQATIEPKQPPSVATSMKTSRSTNETNHSNRSSVSVGSNQTVTQSSISKTESSLESTSPERLKPEEPRLVRFSSLHGARGGVGAVPTDGDFDEEQIVQSVPFVQPSYRPVGHKAAAHHRVTLPAPQKHAYQPQSRHSATPVMSGAVQRPPHPLRQSSPIDSAVDESQSDHVSIRVAQQQDIKRIPKQDVITVIPLYQQSAEAANGITTSPVETAFPSETSPGGPDSGHATEASTKKLQKHNPALSPTKSRRLSLPTAHKFRLPGNRGSETVPLPYSAVPAGPPPETDPSLRPPLPSQTTSARTSMASAAEARDRQTAGSAADSHRTSRSQDRASATIAKGSNASDQQQINGIATGSISDSTGKQIRPSPSFARFIQNLPATHASNVPEAKKFGWRRKGSKQQGVTTIAESEGETATGGAGSTGGKTAQGRRSRATSVTGVSASASQPLPVLTASPVSLPQLQLGRNLGSTATLNRLVNGNSTATTAAEPRTGGFVGGLKLEQMLERERAVAA